MIGKTLSSYEVIAEIGAGGMGTVYQGTDRRTNEYVAIKHLKAELARPELIERFKREGEALRQLNHPNIVKMLDAVEQDRQYYLIIEYLPGGDLNTLLKNGTLPIKQALEIALDLADALTRAHRLNIIHRDLKPANILIAEDGTPRLTDFGVAHFGERERMTGTGAAIGTLDYLSPEALNGDTPDAKTDIWAFGVILFEMLVGHRPFRGEKMSQVITAILTEPVPDLEILNPDIPVALVDLIYRMLERDPHARIASVRHVGAALEDILHGRETDHVQPKERFATPTPEIQNRPKHNLPAQTTPFVGREHELAELAKLVNDPKIRLITILAPGGMGKTHLSLEAAEQQMETFANGVYLVELAPLSDSQNIVPAIADATGYQFQADGREPKQQILDYLREKSMLLVLDNFEHLLDSAGLVSEILRAAPNVKILATSRQRLSQPGETLFHLHGMDFPEWETPEDALNYAAMKLFMNSALRAQPSFELTVENLDHIARICRLVAGMPLGIVLAAAWLAMLTSEEIANEIQQGIDFLADEAGEVPERQRSIRAVFEYSWHMMTPDEQQVFMKMSVFRGGFTREAAQAVTGATLRDLMNLVTKSLLHRDAQTGRYNIHELLRQFGQGILKMDVVQYDAVYNRHAQFYCQLLSNLDHQITFGDGQMAVRQIEPELGNIHIAWGWAVQHRMFEEMSSAEHALMQFREYQNRFVEFAKMYDETEHSLRQFPASPERNYLLSSILVWQSWTALRFGQLEQGLNMAQESLDLLVNDNLTSKHAIGGDARVPLAIIHTLMGNRETARQVGQETLEFYMQQNDLSGIGAACLALTAIELSSGDYQKAQTYGKQGYEAFQRVKHRYLQAYLLNNWGNAEYALENYDEAKRLFRESYNNMHGLGSKEGMATALNNIAQIALLQGEDEEAYRLFEQNVEIFRNIGDNGGLAMTLDGLTQIALAQKDYPRAAGLLSEALEAAGISLGSVTLSILVSTGQLFLETQLHTMAEQVLKLVFVHPATNHEIKSKVEQQLERHGISPSLDTSVTLEQLIYDVKRYLTTVDWQAQVHHPHILEPLTEREKDILRLLAQGSSNQEIADQLVITVGTVKWYLNQIYTKLQVKNRTEAVAQARQLRLLT